MLKSRDRIPFPITKTGSKNWWIEQGKSSGFTIELYDGTHCVYYESLTYYLHEQGFNAFVVLPQPIKKYGQSLSVKSKTDKIDAQILGQMGLERHLRAWKPHQSDITEIKATHPRTRRLSSRAHQCSKLFTCY